jgi:lipopolysaccharide export system permease protein
MSRLNRYLCGNLAATLALAVGIATFIMILGGLTKAQGVLTATGGLKPVIAFVLLGFPEALGYTIPFGVLVATVLVFNRMSSDNEIIAMRAGGVSLLQIIPPMIFFALLLSILCSWLHLNVIPRNKFTIREMIKTSAVQAPTALLIPGEFVEIFPGYSIYVSDRQDNQLIDISIDQRKDGRRIQRTKARSGEVVIDEEKRQLTLVLYNAHITMFDANDASKTHEMGSNRFELPLSYADKLNSRSLSRKVSQMTMGEIFARMTLNAELGKSNSELYVELHMRAAVGLAPLSFLLIAIPFGIRNTRREGSAGFVGAVVIALVYFGMMTFVETLHRKPELHPEFLMWLPNVVCQTAGIIGIWRKR